MIKILSIRLNALEESKYTQEGKQLLLKNRYSNDVDTTSVNSIPVSIASSKVAIDTIELAKQLVDILNDSRADNYDDWIRLGWCLHNIDESLLAKWIQFSKKSDKFVPGECENKWYGMRDQGLTIGSLHMWAKEDDKDQYMKLISSLKTKSDIITMDDIQQSSQAFDYKLVKSVFENHNFKIMNPICYVQVNGDDIIIRSDNDLKKAFQNIWCTITVPSKCGPQLQEHQFIYKWCKDKSIKTFTTMEFLPPPQACPQNVFNLWKGFNVDNIKSESSNDVTHFLHHISILAGHSEQGKEYLCKFLAQLVQQPGKIPGVALVFISQEGAGKNIFWNALFDMLGADYYYETADPVNDLFGRFSTGRKGKLVIDIDEASSKDNFPNHNRLKNMITSHIIQYEQKGQNPMTIRNFARLVFTSNNDMCVKITENDRRYALFEVSNEMIGNKHYFKSFVEYMANIKNQKAIMEYLRGIDISTFNFQLERPMPDTYKAIQSTCADIVLQFMEQCWSRYRSHVIDSFKASEFLEIFTLFLTNDLKLTNEKIKPWNKTRFGLRLKQLCEDEASGISKEDNFGKTRCIAYRLDYEVIETYLRMKGVINDTTCMFLD